MLPKKAQQTSGAGDAPDRTPPAGAPPALLPWPSRDLREGTPSSPHLKTATAQLSLSHSPCKAHDC